MNAVAAELEQRLAAAHQAIEGNNNERQNGERRANGHQNAEDENNMLIQAFEFIYGSVSLVFRLVYFFFLSIHHDWIDPQLRAFDQDHAAV